MLAVALAGLMCAVAAVGAANLVLSYEAPRYRAETQVALLPARTTPPEDLSDYWEALSRGQAARVAAEVLGQRRWIAPAAATTGVPASSITLSAGAVAETTLIDVSLEAGSPSAAETGLNTVIREARPVVEAVSGPFALEVVQSADGSAERLGVAANQLFAVAGATGLLVGSGIALMIVRRRMRRRAHAPASTTPAAPEPGGSAAQTSVGASSKSSATPAQAPGTVVLKPGGAPSPQETDKPQPRSGPSGLPERRIPLPTEGGGVDPTRSPKPSPRTEAMATTAAVPNATFATERYPILQKNGGASKNGGAAQNGSAQRDRPGNAHPPR